MIRNKFSLSHYKLATFEMGKLIPLTWYEALPGDTIQQSTSMLLRVSPLLAPVMHPVRVRIHHWFCPLRIIWDDFEDFITGGPDGTDSTTPPYKDKASVAESDLFDYLGVPPASYSPSLRISALPIRAYQSIFNNHYRDQDLVTEATLDTGNGSDTTSGTLQKVAWEKDYFTTCRTDTQKGTEVIIPIGDTAPVLGIGTGNQTFPWSSKTAYESDDGSAVYASAQSIDTSAGTGANHEVYIEEGSTGYPNIRADLSASTGVPINDLRLALALQRYMEARQRYGSRYVEYLRHLGVRSSDGRISEPEYLGGGRQVVQFSEVLSSDGANTGDMKGHGIVAMRTNRYRRFFEEHGIVMTLASVVPKSIYTQGLHKKFHRDVKEDFFQRELQNLGEQAVLNKEVYTEHTTPDGTFGYQARYDEYRSHPSGVAGDFHSGLDHWHMARIFATDPSLNNTFVEATPTDRVYASTSEDPLYAMANHSIQARRQMSLIAKPKTF